MQRIPLTGGAYAARSIIASAQRCINYYPEKNPSDSPVPVTFYQRPGLAWLVSGEHATVRGIYRASDGQGFCVIGQSVYYIDPTFALVLLGTTVVPGNHPVSFVDNGQTVVLVDSSGIGYTISLGSRAFAQLDDPTGTFTGATRVDYIDTFVIWNIPGTNLFGSTLSNEIVFDQLYIAAKTDYPDPISTLIVNRHEILLMGELKSEIWYDAGNPLFPFAELPGTYIEHGVAAPYSLASTDISVFWLHQDLQGQGMVMRQRGYETTRISNHALEAAIEDMASGPGIADAIGYTYQQRGHVFYVLTFPAGDQTWVFDDSLGDQVSSAWHQRAWTDQNGNLHRDRSNCCAFLYGKNIVGDWENGAIYALDPKTYVDQVAGADGPISYVRSFPHVTAGLGPDDKPREAYGRRMQFLNFALDIECGNGPLQVDGSPAPITFKWSEDRGKTFKQGVLQSSGKPAEWLAQPRWGGVTGYGRDVIFEISHSIAGQAALNSGWVDCNVLES